MSYSRDDLVWVIGSTSGNSEVPGHYPSLELLSQGFDLVLYHTGVDPLPMMPMQCKGLKLWSWDSGEHSHF